jgi:hypothetical protein
MEVGRDECQRGAEDVEPKITERGKGRDANIGE